MVNIEELKVCMLRKKVNQKELAEKIGISERTMISRFKTGIFKSNEIEKIINVLEIKNPAEIFFCKYSYLISNLIRVFSVTSRIVKRGKLWKRRFWKS